LERKTGFEPATLCSASITALKAPKCPKQPTYDTLPLPRSQQSGGHYTPDFAAVKLL